MDGETILTWNVTNWITVVLMAALGFVIVGTGATLIKKAMGGGSSSSQSSQ
jgi:hypothetical protein